MKAHLTWDDENFILKFSDNDSNCNSMDHTDNCDTDENSGQNSKRCESSQFKLDYTQLKQENYSELSNLKINQTVNRKNDSFVDDHMKQKFLSQYLIPASVSSEKQQEISQKTEKDNISDQMVNFSELVNQLLNAKVVIERMCEKSGINEQSAKARILSNESLFKDSIQLYCPECQTATINAPGVTVQKSCSKCDSTLKYLCSNCNSKNYKNSKDLRRHWNRCRLDDSMLNDLKQSNFLVKTTEIDYLKQIIRYCSRCNEVDERCKKTSKKVCQNCDQYLLYQCNKCKAQYSAHSAVLYHMQSRCYPYDLYKCDQCDFTSLVWEMMRRHVINKHLQVHSTIGQSSQLLNAKAASRKVKKPVTEDTLSRTVGVYTNVNVVNEKDFAGEKNCNEYAQRYCATCKKTKFARIEDPMAKNCSDCKAPMTFLCTKCNVKHYKRYPYLQFHLAQCEKNRDYRCKSIIS